MSTFPERINGRGFILHRWQISDLDRLHRAISESAVHLRPWLGFMQKPQTLAAHRRKLLEWSQGWEDGGDAEYGLFVEENVAGAMSLLRRRGPDVLEIGYWIHVDHLGRGLASRASELLVSVAFDQPEIDRLEIHHDAANAPSETVARKLGFTQLREVAVEPRAPLETGVDRIWTLSRADWESSAKTSSLTRARPASTRGRG